MKRCAAFILMICIAVGMLPTLANADDIYDDIYIEKAIEAITDIKKWEQTTLESETLQDHAGESVYDWLFFTKGRLGESGAEKFANAEEKYFADIESLNPSDIQRIALACASCGGDIKGNGMLAAACQSIGEDLSSELINRLIFTLHVLDCGFYSIPESASFTRGELIDEIISRRLDSGALYMINDTMPETDITAMALSALAPYINGSAKIRTAADDMTAYLSTTITEDGTAKNWGKPSCETTAQVITALCAVGIDPTIDERFVKNTASLIDGLLSYKQPDCGFAHNDESSGSDAYATVQAYYALVSFVRFKNGERSLFDMRPDEPDLKIHSIEIPDNSNAQDLLREYNALPPSERMYVYNISEIEQLSGGKAEEYSPDDIAEDSPTAVSNNIFDISNGSSQSLTAGNEGFTALESSQPASAQSSSAVRRITFAETIILVTFALAAGTAIVLNHTVFNKKA